MRILLQFGVFWNLLNRLKRECIACNFTLYNNYSQKIKKRRGCFWTVSGKVLVFISNLHNIHHKKSLVLHLEENVP